jgi:hypothetical protein
MGDGEKSNYITTCVACGGDIKVVNKLRQKHTCSKKREAAQRSANTRGHDALVRRPSFIERLADGFKMLEEDDNGDHE